ncbi:MAG: YbaK/EbsC family protein [Chlamydiales bacterium]
MALSKSAESVQKSLFEKGLEMEVIELAASTRTAQDAATSIGCQIGQIVKSLLFCTKETKQPVLILASGINRVNEAVIQEMSTESEKSSPILVCPLLEESASLAHSFSL